ncbi:flagellar basal body-associated FliL family protein [Pseudooctadecabacter jejudonensis]|uniref:Flagellar protein FliL n=1 Tax=Pseudooctadecabacter jejudonensis TaxID=1391910 RepID=A0A1Y5S842_9RHOB|nr:flagellar basal body-associated FliL family protein [Pseudooctadecabacter jejudonensis]SLN32001.1 hypothetical protein PSJ8397_01490 [Pseudooctadecabacter jejudonensis]
MKKLLLPLILMIVGTAAGGGVGMFLMNAEDPDETMLVETSGNPCGDEHDSDEMMAEEASDPVPLEQREYARMSNQFIVPVILNDKVAAMMVMSLSLEVEVGGQEAVFSHEPRLRDAFLQVMFDHANMGGFNGAFTSTANMRLLRNSLQEAADRVMLGHISDVLIVDIVRQDVTN